MRLFRLLLALLFFVVHCTQQVARYASSNPHYNAALVHLQDEDYVACAAALNEALLMDANNIELHQLLGAISIKLDALDEAVLHLRTAVELDEWKESLIVANYVEALRTSGKVQAAIEAGTRGLHEMKKNQQGGDLEEKGIAQIKFNLAAAFAQLGQKDKALELLELVVGAQPSNDVAWIRGAELLLEEEMFEATELFLKRAVQVLPNHYYILYLLGVSVHKMNRFDEALDWYHASDKSKPNYLPVQANIGAVYQSLGKAEESLACYERLLPLMPNDAGLRNNYGALLGIMNRKEEEIYWLLQALELDPHMENVLVNIGGYYQDEGLLEESRKFLTRALPVSSRARLLRIRMAVFLSPVSSSWTQMIQERNSLERNVLELLSLTHNDEKCTVDSSLDRIHFYLPYHGLNDRYLQSLVVKAYQANIKDFSYISPKLKESGGSLDLWKASFGASSNTTNEADRLVVGARKVRVGFFSKFFGLFEPHGLLLDGAMRFLPRSDFFVIALSVARTDGKPLAHTVAQASDQIVEISLSHEHACEQITRLDIDILVFADTMSEPMAHFLAHTRLAPIQIAFWGNPITSASDHVDYFVSADCMEHPFRTRMPISHEPYSEQVVLMPGQGIWYYRPLSAHEDLRLANYSLNIGPEVNFTKAVFGIQEDWFVFFCPQSVFKMHPLFDFIFARILERVPFAHVIITGGRRPRWTESYIVRLEKALGPVLSKRLHMVERVSSEKFASLLSIADVLLHPFPFDGSKTSADSLQAGLPFVTLPTEYLRGRMGAAFLRTLNLPQLVARNTSEYVDIAARLALDKKFYRATKQSVVERSDLIWEDLEFPFGWAQFLSTVSSLPAPSWETFVSRDAQRDVEKETRLRDQRAQHRREFAETWGSESWLLQDGVASLESHISDEEYDRVPIIFNDWKRVPSSSFYSTPMQANTMLNDSRGDKNIERERDLLLSEMRQLASEERLEESKAIGRSLYPHMRSDPLFLVDLGSIAYFTGDHTEAFELCSEAIFLAPTASIAHTCKGVAGVYLEKEEEALKAFAAADRYGREEEAEEAALMLAPQHGVEEATSSRSPLKSSVFSVSQDAVEVNLVTGLKNFKRYQQCMDAVSEIARLPPMHSGGAYIFIFAFVDWSHFNEPEIQAFEHLLEAQSHHNTNSGMSRKSFMQEIRRVQRDFSHIMNPAIECLTNGPHQELVEATISTLYEIVEKGRTTLDDVLLNQETSPQRASSDQLALISQYYIPSSSERDMQVIISALNQNLANSAIGDIYLLNERLYDLSFLQDPLGKIKQVNIEKRLTFSDAFFFADTHLANRTVILANADVYFDSSLLRLGRASSLNLDKRVLTLLKWTRHDDGTIVTSLRTDSQDAWIFQPPLNSTVAASATFALGTPRCDNRLAHILASSGHEPINPAFAIHAIEIQSDTLKVGLYSPKGSNLGEVQEVLLSDRFIF